MLFPIGTPRGKLTQHKKFYIRAKRSGTQQEWDKFTKVRKQIDRTIRSAHRQHVSSILEGKNPKAFWRYVKSRRTDNTGVQTLKVDNHLISENLEKAEALANQFQSVFTREDMAPSSFPDLPPSPFADMPPIQVDVEGVKKLLLKSIHPKPLARTRSRTKLLRSQQKNWPPSYSSSFNSRLTLVIFHWTGKRPISLHSLRRVLHVPPTQLTTCIILFH